MPRCRGTTRHKNQRSFFRFPLFTFRIFGLENRMKGRCLQGLLSRKSAPSAVRMKRCCICKYGPEPRTYELDFSEISHTMKYTLFIGAPIVFCGRWFAVIMITLVVFWVLGNDSASGATYGLLDHCESTSGWDSQNVLSLDTGDKIAGTASLKSSGSSVVQFQKVFAKPVDAQVSPRSGALQFWYYVSDITKLTNDGRVEISSARTYDSKELCWDFTTIKPGLKNGWNLVTLRLSAALSQGGALDIAGINWFRIYDNVTGSITTKLNAIRFINEASYLDFSNGRATMMVDSDPFFYVGTQISSQRLVQQWGWSMLYGRFGIYL